MEDNYGLIFIPNQPIIFIHDDDPCRGILDTGYCQPFRRDTEIEFQMIRTPCGDNLACQNTSPSFGANIMVDSDFAAGNLDDWTTTGGVWAWDAGTAKKTGGGNAGSIYQSLAGAVGVFRIRVTVTNATAGTAWLARNTTPILNCSVDGTYEVLFMNLNDPFEIGFYGSILWDGNIDNFTVEPVTYCMDGLGWVYDPSTDFYVHIPGTSVPLLAITTYIVPNRWYLIQIEIENRTDGQVRIVAGSNASPWIEVNGFNQQTIFSGLTDQIGIESDVDFDGSVRIVSVYELSQPTQIDLVDNDDPTITVADLLPYHTLDGDRVNVKFSLDLLLIDGAIPGNVLLPACYRIAVDSICAPIGSNLVTNGNFASGSSNWFGQNGGYQFDYTGGELDLIFTPTEAGDYVTNGDFATGDFTGWTASGGLAVVANEVVHTPGTVDTLTQSIVLPAPAVPPAVLSFFVSLTISGRTAGSVSVLLGDVTKTGLTDNNVITFRLTPTVGGAQPLTLTFSSDFDGTVDDITVFRTTQVWSGSPTTFNIMNPLMVAGNYEVSFEIIGSTDPRISVAVIIQGQSQAAVYQSTVGVHTFQILNYVPGQQRVGIIGNFGFSNYAVLGSITVDNIVARPQRSATQPKVSNCIAIMSDADLECHKELVAYSDCMNHGFDFRNFNLRLLVPFLRWGAGYPQKDNVYVHSNGVNQRTSSERDKVWSAKVDRVDEVTHDAISVMLLQDEFKVNGESFFLKSKNYNVLHNKNGRYNLSRATFELSQQNSVVFGNICRDCQPLVAPIECRELCLNYRGAVGDQGEGEEFAGYYYEPSQNIIRYWDGENFIATQTCIGGYIRRIDLGEFLFFNDVTNTWDVFIGIDNINVSGTSGTLTGTIPVNCVAQIQTSVNSGSSYQTVTAMFTGEQIADGVSFTAPSGVFWARLHVRCGSCIYYSPIYIYTP